MRWARTTSNPSSVLAHNLGTSSGRSCKSQSIRRGRGTGLLELLHVVRNSAKDEHQLSHGHALQDGLSSAKNFLDNDHRPELFHKTCPFRRTRFLRVGRVVQGFPANRKRGRRKTSKDIQ